MGDFILEHWNDNAKKFKLSHQVSWGDIYAIKLETQNISNYIHDGDTVLDVGCANGFAAIMQCEAHKLKKVVGIDFSDEMLTYAEENKANSDFADILEFKKGDIRKLDFADDTFDVVYTTRVIINLPTWEQQKQAVSECIRVAKPGGVIILSEAFYEPFIKINALRTIAGLNPLIEHDFNRYIKRARLNKYLEERGLNFEINDFSSVYYIGSRFLRELSTDYTKFEGFSNPINEDFFELEKNYSGGDFGIQQAYIIHK